MLQRICLVSIGCLFSLAAISQTTSLQPTQAPQPVQPTYTYKKLNAGLQYAYIINKSTSPRPVEGDEIKVNMIMVCNNRLLFSTAQANKGKPALYVVNKPSFKGDIIEAIMQMTPGDSIVCLVNADSLFKNTKNKKPDFIKTGDKLQYFIKLLSIKPKAEVQKEQQAAFMKQIKEQQAKQKAAEAKQMIKDDKDLQAYFAKGNITPIKTTSGMYYTIKQEGTGDNAIAGDSVTMNYTGTLLNGTKFDSNEDTAFHHVAPFQFVLGRGQVIKGWDEGVALLKQGSKATFYIPSPMAYGAQNRPSIPANSILLFDVQLVNIKHPVSPPPPVPVKPIDKTDSLTTPKQ